MASDEGRGRADEAAHGDAADGGVGDLGAKKKKKKEKKKKVPGSSRGIETMFRTAYRVHTDLSSLADHKANIMISVNGLIISITLGTLAPRIATHPLLALPTGVLVFGCLLALIYAVLSARPRVSSAPVSLDDVVRNEANILFFGHFTNMREEDFVAGMLDLLGNTDHLYTNMIRDLYGLGQVLKRKFQLLRLSYTVFMLALVLGVVAFFVVFALQPEAPGLIG
ncbi:MAG: hypothetical protein D6701_01780 [Gemmatimonadetes bacterium]|nr:MAG: hypothetical protein D6701_01780 [Gemmatimonadota bacterium]